MHDGNLLLSFLNIIPSILPLSIMQTARHAALQRSNNKKFYLLIGLEDFSGSSLNHYYISSYIIHIPLGMKINLSECFS